MGDGTGALLVFPVALAAWLFGFRTGLLSGVGAAIIGVVLGNLVGEHVQGPLIAPADWIGIMIPIAMGGLIGRLSDLKDRLRAELDRVNTLQEACQRRDQHYQRVVEHAHQPIIVVRNGRFVWANQATTERTGLDFETLTGRPFLEFVHPDDREKVTEMYRRRTAGELTKETYSLRVLAADGTVRWFSNSGVNIDWYGEPATLNFLTDITDRKRVERDYVEQLGFLQSLIDSIPNPVFYKNLDGVYKRCNQAFADFLGMERQDILGQTAADIAPDELAKTYHQRDLELIEQGGNQVYETRVINAEGQTRQVRFHKAVVRDAEDRIRGLVGIVVDLTDVRTAEQDLKTSTERFTKSFDRNPVPMTLVDTLSGELIEANRTFLQLFGLQRDRAIGQKLSASGVVSLETCQSLKTQVNDRGSMPPQRITANRADGLPIRIVWSAESIDIEGRHCILSTWLDVTEEERAREAERTSEKRYRMLADHSSDIISVFAENGELEYISPACERVLGYTAEELEGTIWWDLLVPEDRSKADDLADQLVKSSGQEPAFHRFRHKSGHPVWLESYAQPLTGEDGFTDGHYLCTSRDISARVRAQTDLRLSEERLSLVIEATDDGIWDWNVETGDLMVNEQWATMLGYELEEIPGNDSAWTELMHPDDKDHVLKRLTEHFEGRHELYSVEHRLKTKDGEYKWILARGKVVERDEDGKPLRMTGTHRDVHEQRMAEIAREESEKRYALLFEAIGDGVLITSEHRCVDCNESACRLLGLSREELIGLSPFDVSAERQPDGSLSSERIPEITEGLEAGSEQRFEWLYRRSDGTEFLSEMWLKRLELSGSSYIFAVMRDITERRRAEEALHVERNRLSNIIEGTSAGTWEWNVQTGETVFNERWAEMLGYTLEELTPVSIDTWIELTHPDDLKKANELLEKHFSGESDHYDCEMRMRHRDGHWVWIQDRGRVTSWNDDGKPLWMFGTHMDISERKAGEQALLESESRNRAITDSAQDAIVMMDPEGRISFWNPAAERIFGYSHRAAIGQNLHKLIAPERYHEAHQEAFKVFLKTGDGEAVGKTSELGALTKSGQEIAVELSLSAIMLGDGWHAVGIMRDITARKETEAKLKKAVDEQSAIFESSLVGIMVLHDRIITKVNRRMAEMLGYEPHELEGHGPENLHLSYDNFVEFGETYYWRLAETEIVQIEYPLKHKDGHTVWCQFNGKAIDPPDLSRGAVWIIEDMTERRQAQEAIRKSEQKLSLHVQETPLAYIELDTDFKVRAWNPAAEKIFGYTRDEVLDKEALDLIIEHNTIQHVSSVLQQLLDNSGGRRSTNNNRTKDGQIITCDWYNTPLTDEAGHITGIACLAMDVTETHRAQEELRESEERFRLFFELGMIGMGIKAADLSWVHCNERLCDIVGYDRDELLRKDWLELIHPDDRDAATAAYRSILSGQADSYTLEKRVIHKSGDIVDLMVSAKCLRDTDGTVRSIITLFQDITVRKRAMEALSHSEAQNRAIVSALPDLMFRMRGDGTFLDFNAPEDTVLLHERDEIIGANLEDLEFPAEFVNLVQSRITNCLRTQLVDSFEYTLPVSDQERHFEARVTPCGEDEVLFLVRDITERKLATERIQHQAEFLKTVLESIPHPFYVIDPDTMKIKMANSATHSGVLPPEATCHSLTHKSDEPCSGENHPCTVQKVRNELEPCVVEHIHYDRHGDTRTVEIRAFPVLNRGKLTDIIEYSTDITDRKKNEMRLAMLATFAENNPGMIVTLDTEAQMQYANPATEVNLARMNLTVDKLHKVLPHNIRDIVSRCIVNAETVQGLEVRYDRFTLLWDFHPVPGQQIVHAFAEDISDRIRREQELRKLSHAINQSPTIIIITDPDGTIEYVNPHFTKVTGYTLMEAVGENVSILSSGKHDNEFYHKLWSTISSGETWNGRIQNRRKNGEIYWQRTTISPIIGENGLIASYLGVAEDITAEVKSQQQLMESDKLAAIGTLAAGVAHEFKNYLGGIIGNASFALDDLDKDVGVESAKEILSQIIEMGEKANDVAMSLLTFSKAQSDDYSPEDLKKIILRSIAMVEKELSSQSIELVTYIEEDIPPVEISASKIQQILMNLFINAQHAIGSDGVITVALVREKNDVLIKVGDTGAGISEENLSRIFDPFFSTKGVWGRDELAGTGMGLAIGRNIAREHGGDLTAESVEGAGTTFTLSLPLNRNRGDNQEPRAAGTRNMRLLLFTLNRKILSHYHPQASAERINLIAVDAEHTVEGNLRRVADAVICDARFCAKIELFRMAQTCMEHGVPYIMINCGQMEYQLAELFEKSRRNFKGLPALTRIMGCVDDSQHLEEPSEPSRSSNSATAESLKKH
jgi:PAS domain S-box-containing protein